MSNNPSASPHMSHLSHNGSAPASPSMSSQVQGNAQQGYTSGANYPSPAHYSQYTGQANPTEQYRSSPTGSNGSMPLPSMRSIDPSQAQQVSQAQHMANSHLGGGPPGPYYHGGVLPPPPSSHYPNVTSDPSGRYVLPQDNRVMSGGRHKKEIKRRTKTGCLTCRKRRIKCDEAHPACRNCQKSKRDCLGYDPIFKQNPGPTAIQPALSAAPPPSSNMPPAGNPYGNQPPMYTHGMPYDQNMPGAINSPGQGQQPQYAEYSAVSAIDPSLEALAPSQPQAMPNFREELQKGTAGAAYPANTSETTHLRGGAPSKSTPLSTSLRYGDQKLTYGTPAQATSVTEILDLLGPPAEDLPANSTGAQDPQIIDELKHLYHSIYSPGLENFLETKYFPIKGVGRLLGDKPLLEQFIVLIRHFAATSASDVAGLKRVSVIETRLIWALADMVRAAATTSEATNGTVKVEESATPPPEDPVQAGHRLSVFENLLTFNFADENKLYKANHENVDYHRGREFEFWYHLGTFVTIKDSDPNAGQRIDEILLKMRNLLDGRENRDVLYSIAVVRAIGNRVADFAEQEVPHHLDETDDRQKLFVAKKFIRDESAGNGTTNVIRRLCDMVLRSWTPPPAPAKAS